MTPLSRRRRTVVGGVALLAVAITPALSQIPAVAVGSPSGVLASVPGPAVAPVATIGDTVAGLVDVDRVGAALAPTAGQRSAATALGSGVEVTWNDLGTPASVLPRNGTLAPSAGKAPVATARAYLLTHADLLGIDADQVRALDLVSAQQFQGSTATAVLFRQRFGDLVPATRSMATVGIAADGSVSYLSSSLVKVNQAPAAATLTPAQGWLAAATNVQRGSGLSLSQITSVAAKGPGGWTRLTVPGFADAQQARVRAFARTDGSVRPVIEANVVDAAGGTSFAYRVLVDAVSGEVLMRQNAVDNATDAFPFQGTYTSTACSAAQPFTVAAGTRTIAIVAAALVPTDDITILLSGPGTGLPREFDAGTSPESATYSDPSGAALTPGAYSFQVCPFGRTGQTGGPYTAAVTTTDVAPSASAAALPRPTWRAFTANPSLPTIGQPTGFSPDNSTIECWNAGTSGCSTQETHQNTFSFGAWDTVNGVPSLTTVGNNANTHEAWASPLTPGGTFQAPYSPTRSYTAPFTDAWNNSRCNPANLVPGGNDINQVTTNLFVGHNRIHDFAYALGFTEANYNLQLSNGDRGGAGGDPEVGNVQAGALSGGAVGMYMGRDNANQIALQDGVPGITNQYLFQPIAGSFYSPCTDGALDTSIYGHEYTHAISNRMVGGPDDGLTSEQGGAMGESWSDLVASEYQFENDYPTGTNPWSLGSYATGNFTKGIRDYAINDNPLNYSDYGFDTTGPEVHADGEIWNGTLWEVRQALVNKWDAAGVKYADKALQERCEQPTSDPTRSQLSAEFCPGNRRWLQLVFDAWLLQPGATDMLQARNAMLAADRMRFGGANQADIASAFARRGMGADASTPTPDSEDVKPSFRSDFGNNSTVTFASASPGKVYVGNFEARSTPVASTGPGGSPSAVFTPGIYRMTFVSPTSGFRRFLLTVNDTGVNFSQPIDDKAVNIAAVPSGASVIAGATTAGSRNAEFLVDGTEATNWGGVTTGTNVDASQPAVAVDLAGTGARTISSAKVSALLRPAPVDPNALPLLADGTASVDDPDSASRFTALRQFALQRCTAGCDNAANYSTFYTSPADAFPADIPRPVAPDQTMRTFRFAPVEAAAVRLVTLQNQCTGQAKYAGEQDADTTNATDCKTASDRGTIVHAAELQIFGDAIPDDPADAAAGDGSPGSGTAGQGTAALPLRGQAFLGATTAAAQAGLAKTRTRIRLPRIQQVRGQESTKMKYAVVSPTTSLGKTAGRIKIRLDGKIMKRKNVAVVLKMGRKVSGGTFRVPASLGYGRHKLKVIFRALDPTRYTDSKSRTVILTVVRSRPGR